MSCSISLEQVMIKAMYHYGAYCMPQIDLLRSQACRQPDLSSSAESIAPGIFGDGETTSIRLPDELLVVVMLAGHDDSVGDQERRVETHTELTNQILAHVLSFLHLGKEFRGARLRDSS